MLEAQQSNEPSLPSPLLSPPLYPQLSEVGHDDISIMSKTDDGLSQNQKEQKSPYQHFIPYSSFRESVKKSGIIIPRVTQAANIALQYHDSLVARPPGFGKTFIINILESLFLREKSLFQRESHFTKIDSNGVPQFENRQVGYETNNDRDFNNDVKEILEQWSWNTKQKMIVLRFDFSTILLLSNDDEAIHNAITQLVIRVVDANDLTERVQLHEFLTSKKNKLKNPKGKYIQCDSLIDYFLTRLDKMNEEYAILIDDADYIMRMTEDYSNRVVISFFHAILKHSKKYQFLFATCVFPTSIPFTDISQNPDISTTFGFTLKDICELEILDDFLLKLKNSHVISRCSQRYFQSKADLLNEINFLYGGYCFSPLSEYSVLNPISVIECIENFSFEDYWSEKALPWREENLATDFLNYFTIFKQPSTLLFNDLILKILKCPDYVSGSVRNHFIYLFYFGFFTCSDNNKKVINNLQANNNTFTWKIPNAYIYQFLSELLISFLQMRSNIFPTLLNESTNEFCIAFRDSINDKFLSFYFLNEYYDLYVAAVLASCGLTVHCRFYEPFILLTAESLNNIFLINIYKNSDPIQIAELTFKMRYNDGAEVSKQTSKNIVFMIVHFGVNKIQVLTCEPDFSETNSSQKLQAQYESQEYEIIKDNYTLNQNIKSLNTDLMIQSQQMIKKKATFQNSSHSPKDKYNLNSSLINYLKRNSDVHSSEQTPNVSVQSSNDSANSSANQSGQIH